MFINKIGMEHVESGMNCQDYGIEGGFTSIICDGCSEGKHSEVGAKLFCHIYEETYRKHKHYQMFEEIIQLLGDDPKTLKDFMSFTILTICEFIERWNISYCGDGYIILQDHDGNITFKELTDGEYPKYYVYNYIDKEHLKHYKDGVSFSQKTFSKEEYKKVGIASDGLRFILQADEELKQEFIDCLKSGKEIKTKLFINRNHKIFRDDITIVF